MVRKIKVLKKRSVVGFFKDEDGTTRPVTKSAAELKRKKIVKKPRKFKGISPTARISLKKSRAIATEISSLFDARKLPEGSIKEIYAFGSQVRKDKKPKRDSDLDMLIVLDTPFSPEDKEFHIFERWSNIIERQVRKAKNVKLELFLTHDLQDHKKHIDMKGAVKILSRKQKVKAVDDAKWSAHLKKRTKSYLKRFPELKPLKKKLLAVGGDFVVLLPEPDLKKILKRGRVFKPTKIKMLNMEASHCHTNVAQIWSSDATKGTKIVTGWALSDDGLWRQHSWLKEGKTLLETTVARDLYYGVVLNNDEAEDFFWDNT